MHTRLKSLVYFSALIFSLLILKINYAQAFFSTPKMVLFFAHGLGGDQTTFCDLEKILNREFKGDVLSHNLKYSTISPDLKPIEFANEIHEQIVEFYERHNLPTDTPFGLIGHSQGGIVSLRYVDLCINKSKCHTSGNTILAPKNLKLLLTYGTPYWGSPTAAKLTSAGLNQYLDGAEQIEHLATGSLTMNNNRTTIMQALNKERNIFPEDTTVINVAGEATSALSTSTWLSFFKYLFGLGRFIENDIVVTNSSARLDFLYLIEDFDGQIKEGITNLSQSYFIVDYPHTELKKGKPGLACIYDNKNINGEIYKYRESPPYKALHNALAKILSINDVIPNQNADYLYGLTNFLVEIRLQFQPGYERIIDTTQMPFVKLGRNQSIASYLAPGLYIKPKVPENFDNANLDNTLLNTFQGINNDKNHYLSKKFVNLYHEGQLKPMFALRQTGFAGAHQIEYKANIEGFKPKEFKLFIQPTYSTFARLYLEPNIPLPASNDISCLEKGCQKLCYTAKVARRPGAPYAQAYKATDSEYTIAQLKPGASVRVYGRYGSGLKYSTPPYLHEKDMLLVHFLPQSVAPGSQTKTKSGLGWINTNEIDIIAPCGAN